MANKPMGPDTADGSGSVRGRVALPTAPATERLVACVGPSPTSARVIQAASRMAVALGVPWVAVTIAPGRDSPAADKLRIVKHLQLAESLGATTATLAGGDVAQELVAYARDHGATRIVIGRTGRRRWPLGLSPSLVDKVISGSGEIDVHVVRGAEGPPYSRGAATARWTPSLPAYLGSAGLLAVATAIAGLFGRLGFGHANLVLVYMLGVTATAAWLGRGPAIMASVGAVLLYNYFFTEPLFTLRVHDSGYIVTFAVMMTIGLLVSTLTTRIREQSLAARQRERRTEQLYEFSRELSATSGEARIVAVAVARLEAILGARVIVLLPDDCGDLRPADAAASRPALDGETESAARWAFEHRRPAGRGAASHSQARARLLPLAEAGDRLGVLVVDGDHPEDLLMPEGRRLVESCATQLAAALRRDRLVEEVHRTNSLAESERLRSSLLSSISHDFRTPLSAIAGIASSMLATGDRLDADERKDLLRSLHDEAVRLARLVDSLLQMTRIEAGRMTPNREWNLVEDIVGAALTRTGAALSAHRVITHVPADLPMVRVDGSLVELILTNLLENAARYAPAGTDIEVSGRATGVAIEIEVADRGGGLSAEDEARAFEKFYRGARWRSDGSRGAGLGLAICAAIARLHEGTMSGRNRAGGGASFVLTLPREEQPPEIEIDRLAEDHEEDWT